VCGREWGLEGVSQREERMEGVCVVREERVEGGSQREERARA